MKLDLQLQEVTSSIFKALYNAEVDPGSIQVQETRKDFVGDRTIVVFPLLRYSKKKPEETAQQLGDALLERIEFLEGFNVVKGFLNLSFKPAFWIEQLLNASQPDKRAYSQDANDRVMVEYSSPNTNKPLHLGHIRNNLLGYSVSEILKARGHTVIKANLVNDRGIHICKSMLAWLKFGNGETPETAGQKGDHFVGKYYVEFDKAYKREVETLIHQGADEEQAKKNAPLLKEAQALLVKWEEGDDRVTRLWKKMNAWVYKGFDSTYDRMGVDFDKFYYESDTYLLGKELVKEGLEKGVFFEKENGSIWVDLIDEGLDEKLLLRSDGTSVYITQDMGTAQLKYEDYSINRSIYVVGNEQDYHFKVLQAILKKMGKAYAEGIFHLSYGMVDLPGGKMKSREGTVVDADDLMDEMEQTARAHTEESGKVADLDEKERSELYETLGLGALKFYLLKNDPKKRMLFDPQESIDFQGHTGPFVQYTHARIASVLRKANAENIDYQNASFEDIEIHQSERELLKSFYDFESVMKEAETNLSPALIANYLYRLAKDYNKFYHECSILREEDKTIIAFRLKLSESIAELIKYTAGLLGMSVPDRM